MYPLLAAGSATVAGGSFTPTDLASLFGWWDASDTGSITESAGGVSQWNDLSGNGYHLTQATAGLKPTTGATTRNALNVVDFDGGDSLAYDAGSDSLALGATTVLMAVNSTSGTTGRRFVSVMTGAVSVDYASGAGVLLFNAATDTLGVYASANGASKAYTPSSWMVARSTSSGSSSSAAVNGSANTAALTSGITNVRYLYLGGTSFEASSLSGSVAELIVCDAVLDSTDLAAAEAYLSAKWL